MRLLLALIAASNAAYTNWNWYESQIHFQYKGGIYPMIGDLFTDFGYPEEFLDLWATATDDSIMEAMASVIINFVTHLDTNILFSGQQQQATASKPKLLPTLDYSLFMLASLIA